MRKYEWISHLEWLIMFLTLIVGFYRIHSKIESFKDRIDKFIEERKKEIK